MRVPQTSKSTAKPLLNFLILRPGPPLAYWTMGNCSLYVLLPPPLPLVTAPKRRHGTRVVSTTYSASSNQR